MNRSTTFNYGNLSSKSTVRIVILHPAIMLSSPIHCSLYEQSLDNLQPGDGPFEALSYVWGSEKAKEDVICDGKTFVVTQNCLDALRYLRLKTSSRQIFIDAICINQTSTIERNHQVKLMGKVYQLAKLTTVWLGQGDKITHRWLKNLNRASRILAFENWCARRNSTWQSISHIAVNKFFNCKLSTFMNRANY
jgi:hypothetical protein